MIGKFLSVITLCLLLPGIAAYQSKSDAGREGYKGAVHTFEIESTEYNESEGNMVKGRHRNLESGAFDLKGNLIERIIYDDYGFLVGKETHSHDPGGNLTASLLNDPKGVLQEKTVSTYGTKGELAQIITYDSKGVVTLKQKFVYDEKGNIREEVYYEQDKPMAKTIYKFDEKKNNTEVAFYLADGSKATAPIGPCFGAHRVAYRYDAKNELIGKTAYEENGDVKRTWTYNYDNKGNIAGDIRMDYYSTLKFTYNYEYDLKGNWIKQISFVHTSRKPLEGNTPDVSERKIETIRKLIYY